MTKRFAVTWGESDWIGATFDNAEEAWAKVDEWTDKSLTSQSYRVVELVDVPKPEGKKEWIILYAYGERPWKVLDGVLPSIEGGAQGLKTKSVAETMVANLNQSGGRYRYKMMKVVDDES